MKYTLKEIRKSEDTQEFNLFGFTLKAKTDTYILDCGFYEIPVPIIRRDTNWFIKLISMDIDEQLLSEYLETAEFPLVNLAYTYSEFVNDMLVGYRKYVKKQKKLNKINKERKEDLYVV